MEFDKSKILTVVTADQAKVGQKGWFSNDIHSLKIYIERGDETKELQSVDSDNEYTFREQYPIDGSFACKYRYFYPAPEPTYAERQAQWVKENSVKVGTKVRFTKGFEEDADGSFCCEHRDAKGVEGCIDTIKKRWLSVSVPCGGWAVPFTALEVIKEPTYRPFNEDELNNLVGKIVRNKQTGYRKLVTGKPTTSLGVNLEGKYINAKDLLNSFMMDDGKSPCGIKEEV